MGIENTTQRDPLLNYAGMLGSGGQTGYVEEMEAAGQRQLVNSDRLPTETSGTDDAFEAVGFVFGTPDRNDPMFRPATLPEGWRREGSEHAMWSYLVDQYGRRRVAIFYKAAFYDRSAFMRLETPAAYFSSLLYGDGEPVLDDSWLTPEVADETLAAIRDSRAGQAAEARRHASGSHDSEYWTGRAAEHDASAKKAEALRLRVAEMAAA